MQLIAVAERPHEMRIPRCDKRVSEPDVVAVLSEELRALPDRRSGLSTKTT